ncbi:MAG: Lrp/AsnC family transcriptional regulator [Candidatus Altiarchaeota archaeon]|nr:Lrp/AsnC family transcriptional regulator [Candidatus Altiarchaeota archaeon]
MEEMRAVIGIKSREGRLGEIGNQLTKRDETLALYEVTGEFDIIAVCKFEGTMGLERFIKEVLQWKYVERTTTFVVLNIVKECAPPKL